MNWTASISTMDWSASSCVKSSSPDPARMHTILFKLHWSIKRDRSSSVVSADWECSTRSSSTWVSFVSVPTKSIISDDEQLEGKDAVRSLSVYRVPLEHFPSLEKYYPERVVPPIDETESAIEIKPSKMASSHTKKTVSAVEVDKAALIFDEKIKELFRKR